MSAPASTSVASETGANYDNARHDAFGERVLGMLNHASLAFMFSIGHRTGLFDALRRMNRRGHGA